MVTPLLADVGELPRSELTVSPRHVPTKHGGQCLIVARIQTTKVGIDTEAGGIRVCKRWLTFENFYADMGEPPKGLTIERMKNHLGYSPENCEWKSRRRQQNNLSTNVHVNFNGKKKTLAQWSRRLGIEYSTLNHSFHRGSHLKLMGRVYDQQSARSVENGEGEVGEKL